MRYIAILLLLTGTLSAQTKWRQIERSLNKWNVPAAYDSIPGQTGYAGKWISLASLIDTLEISGGSTTGIGAANRIAYWKTTDTITYDSAMFWDKNNKRLGLGVSNPQFVLHTNGDINVNGVRIGTGADNDSTNIAIGKNALENYFFLDPGYNTAIGNNALRNNVLGLGNNAIGALALEDNTLGSYNLGMGAFALRNNTDGNYNTANGYASLESNVLGSFNIAFGSNSGQFETGSYKLYISSVGSSNLTDSRQKSIIYGEQSPTTANQILNLNAKVKPTYKPGTATGLAGYDSGGYLANVNIGSGLNLSSGTLSASGFTGGSGTTNYIPRWISSTSLGNSIIQDNGSNVNVNGAPDASYIFKVNSGNIKIGDATANSQNRVFFGDGTAVSVGEELTDNRLVMKGSAMSFNINGSYGASGNVLMSNGLSATWQPITGANSDLFFTGTSSPYTLNSSNGTDVQISAGAGINLSMVNNNLTIGSTSSTPATWFDWGSYIENWANTGTFGSGKNVGISTPSSGPSRDFDVNGDVRFRGAIYNSSNSAGTTGQVLTSNGVSAWSWATPADNSATNEAQTLTLGTNQTVALSSVAGVGGGSFEIPQYRHASMWKTSNLSGQTLDATPRKLTFDSQVSAPGLVANTTNGLITPNVSGIYRIDYSGSYSVNATYDQSVLFQLYNGAVTFGYQSECRTRVSDGTVNNMTNFSKTIVTTLNANQAISLYYTKSVGTNATITFYNLNFSIQRIN
jgi:hypothetical protein